MTKGSLEGERWGERCVLELEEGSLTFASRHFFRKYLLLTCHAPGSELGTAGQQYTGSSPWSCLSSVGCGEVGAQLHQSGIHTSKYKTTSTMGALKEKYSSTNRGAGKARQENRERSHTSEPRGELGTNPHNGIQGKIILFISQKWMSRLRIN